jgi:hypothetical protein
MIDLQDGGNQLTTRIALEKYVYEDIYPAFKDTTDEKQITANLSRAFLNHLADRRVVLDGDGPAMVADIGCGPCDTIVMYLTGVRFAPGFIVRAMDFLPEYADSRNGEALRVLAGAQAKSTIRLVDFAVRAGDAFGGKLLDLLAAPDGAKPRSAFRIVFASHMMYHADGIAGVRRMIADVAGKLLDAGGICIMFHLATTPGTFQDFRARFGSEAGRSSSDTGAVAIDDPPAQIARVCGELKLPLHQMDFTDHSRFGRLGDDEWRAFRNPDAYDALAGSNPGAYEDLKRLYFIVQRAPREFAADGSSTGLGSFMDEMRSLLERTRGALPLAERMQVFTRTDAPASLNTAIPAALAAAAQAANQ